jgi:hypothetical protein
MSRKTINAELANLVGIAALSEDDLTNPEFWPVRLDTELIGSILVGQAAPLTQQLFIASSKAISQGNVEMAKICYELASIGLSSQFGPGTYCCANNFCIYRFDIGSTLSFADLIMRMQEFDL